MSPRKAGPAQGRTDGKREDKLQEEVRIIENLLREGLEWPAIERIMGVGETQFQALKQQVADLTE